MDLNLTGKTVLVTGGSKGIGLGVAKAFAAEGSALHLVSRSAENLAAGKKAIQERHDVEVALHAHDLSDSSAVDALVSACPKIDVLVNNAGAIPGGDLDAVQPFVVTDFDLLPVNNYDGHVYDLWAIRASVNPRGAEATEEPGSCWHAPLSTPRPKCLRPTRSFTSQDSARDDIRSIWLK